MNFKNKEELELRLSKLDRCLTFVDISRGLEVPYQTLVGWKIKNPEYYETCEKYLFKILNKNISDQDLSKVSANIISKKLSKELDLENDSKNDNNEKIIINLGNNNESINN